MFSAAGKSAVTSGYNINNSLRFRRSATAFLSRTPASAGNRKTFTYSAWIKRGLSGNNNFFNVNPNGGYGQFSLNFDLDVPGDIGVYQNTNNANIIVVATNAVFRDFSAWYHIVVAIDTTQATPANRVLIYVNGVSQALTISTQVALNTDLHVNNTLAHNIGKEQSASGGSANYFDGYMAEINFIDGQALTPSSFGETDGTTGVWKPKKYVGSYGTNGFYLPFSDIATTSGSNAGLGKDFSGNSNYWTTNNISVTSGVTYDAMLDSPTLTSATVANYAVMNPLVRLYGTATLSDSNLKINDTSSGGGAGYATIAVTSGKFYYEFSPSAVGKLNGMGVTLASTYTFGYDGCYLTNGSVQNTTGGTAATYASYTTNDVIGVAFDADAGKIWFYKNGTLQGGNPVAGTGSPFTWTANSLVTATYAMDNSAGTVGINVNFGQRPFTYTPPSGFVALNTFNLPNSVIPKGSSYMNVATYTGSSSNVTVTSGFYPDFAWAKSRNATYNHSLFDSVRGGNNVIFSNLTNAESTTSGLATFSSTGVTWLAGAGGINADASTTYVNWFWNAGSGTTTVNTSGSISSNVSVNTTAGFSVVTYTWDNNTSTIGHGLGVKPSMIIVKSRDSSVYNWTVYHSSLGATKQLVLNSTLQALTTSNPWNDTEPNSSVFTIGTNWSDGTTPDRHVAYCWAEIAGFSKFGSYTGNGSTDGPFVYLGFRPSFVIIKRTDSGGVGYDWNMYDNKIGAYNVIDDLLKANKSDAETTYYTYYIDFLSNGFKLREGDTGQNANGGTYIYAAYAENPFKNALAR